MFKKIPSIIIGSSIGFCAASVASGVDNSTAGDEVSTEVNERTVAIEEIFVMAQKRGVAESAQDVPIAITAMDYRALERAHVQDLQSLSAAAPNVTLDDVGTLPGVANFAIRGLGVNSSIPSVEPAVGTFVDGIYLGVPFGAVLNLFDIDSIEILRGPQGLLFGRNTTGGAVSIRTRRPGDEFLVRGSVGAKRGPQYTVNLSVEGPIVSDQLRAKIAGHYDKDQGWFSNKFDDSGLPEMKSRALRGTLVWEPSDEFDSTLILERTRVTGDGTVAQNTRYQNDFDISIDEPGSTSITVEGVTLEFNQQVALGEGIITGLIGVRSVEQYTLADVDAQPRNLFHVAAYLDQEQFSGELRYAGSFDDLELTMGLYYFEQDYIYLERRNLFGGAVDSTFGGEIDQQSWAAFGQAKYYLTPKFAVTMGLRYSYEKKDARIATFNISSQCDFDTLRCNFNFPGPQFPGSSGDNVWRNVTPKVGMEWHIDDNALAYAHWSQGVRSGGYNVRSTSATFSPGPYDEEKQDAFEAGIKSDFLDNRLRVNFAAFYNKIDDLQRDVLFSDPLSGAVAVTRNTADAVIQGAELEVKFVPVYNLELSANAGYTDGTYSNVKFDLNADGVVNQGDESLDIPRLAPWSYGVGIAYTLDLDRGDELDVFVNFSHRDRVAFSDSNSKFLTQVNDLSAGVTYTFPKERVSVSIYGKNLTNKVTDSNLIPLPESVGGGEFRIVNEGRSVGAEMKFEF
jgi:iron complex outermembrane recepter protein